MERGEGGGERDLLLKGPRGAVPEREGAGQSEVELGGALPAAREETLAEALPQHELAREGLVAAELGGGDADEVVHRGADPDGAGGEEALERHRVRGEQRQRRVQRQPAGLVPRVLKLARPLLGLAQPGLIVSRNP